MPKAREFFEGKTVCRTAAQNSIWRHSNKNAWGFNPQFFFGLVLCPAPGRAENRFGPIVLGQAKLFLVPRPMHIKRKRSAMITSIARMANATISRGKQETFAARVSALRKHYLKDEQKLSKMLFDLCGALRRQHTLAQEHLNTYEHAGKAAQTPRSKLLVKSVSFRKLLLKDEQRLAKKKWELACCLSQQEALEQETPA